MKLKFNNGNGALLCDDCDVIIYTGVEMEALGVPYNGTAAPIRRNAGALPKLHIVKKKCLCETCFKK